MADERGLTRADFLKSVVVGAVAAASPLVAAQPAQPKPATQITIDDLRSFANVCGLSFSDAEYESVLKDVQSSIDPYHAMRKDAEDYGLFPKTVFRAAGVDELGKPVVDVKVPSRTVKRPASDEDLAFMPVADLAHLVKTRQITSVELTELALSRLKRCGPQLVCVAALTEERARQKAREADADIAAGRYRGPLHGIPCGIKDLFALKGYPTQWGTEAFRGQVIDLDAAVVERLDKAGAIICAKLSLGALAMNDNWYEGRTKNPWKPSEGSSGSSAGSASAVAAGLVPFAIGTETSGSIVSPSNRCRVTGFRPTFGSISRYGAMALCWTLDKVGPICRTAEDAALVFGSLVGYDPRDASTVRRPFAYRQPKDLAGLKIGVVGRPFDKAKAALESLGASFESVSVPPMNEGLYNILAVESAAMFDEITRSGRLNLVKENEWAQYWRAARFVPAVEYAQAERGRALLIRAWEKAFAKVDLVLAASLAGTMIYPGNLAGWPHVLVPMGATDKGVEQSVSLIGKPFDDARLLSVAYLLQGKLPFHTTRPDLRALG